MKKRLRKKKHLGEFTEYGRYFLIKTTNETNDSYCKLEDDFIEMLEANNMVCGGGFGKTWNICIELGTKDVMSSNLDIVIKWLDHRDDIIKYRFGMPFDVWNEDNLDEFKVR